MRYRAPAHKTKEAVMATALKDYVERLNDSCAPAFDSVADAVRSARNTVADVRDATKEAAEQLELAARRRPLAAVGVAAAAGFVTGGLLAFGLGWFAARRTGR
jgi:ElaB/YqjD/DUF883 family membrane-anchored ribosome-binding protein